MVAASSALFRVIVRVSVFVALPRDREVGSRATCAHAPKEIRDREFIGPVASPALLHSCHRPSKGPLAGDARRVGTQSEVEQDLAARRWAPRLREHPGYNSSSAALWPNGHALCLACKRL